MKIHVKSSGYDLRIPVPTGLVFGKIPVWIWLKLMKKSQKSWSGSIPESTRSQIALIPGDLPEKAVYTLCAELMRTKRRYGSWKLVEVESADGDEVLIEL